MNANWSGNPGSNRMIQIGNLARKAVAYSPQMVDLSRVERARFPCKGNPPPVAQAHSGRHGGRPADSGRMNRFKEQKPPGFPEGLAMYWLLRGGGQRYMAKPSDAHELCRKGLVPRCG